MLQSIGCDKERMLQTACEQNGGDIDVKKVLQIEGIEESLNKSIFAVFGESRFQNRVSAEDDGIVDDLETAEPRCDSELDILKEVETRMEKAVADEFPAK